MLDDVAPDNFKHSEYFSIFFHEMGLTDECGLLLHFEGNAAVFISLGIEDNRSSIDTGRVERLFPLISALSRRHWAKLSPENVDGSGRLSAHLNSAFENFGASQLSPRESEIARMILQGHSSKAMARVFGNSPETIKVHRKRIYSKLGTTSQSELLSLFLEALTCMPPTANGDPLLFVKELTEDE